MSLKNVKILFNYKLILLSDEKILILKKTSRDVYKLLKLKKFYIICIGKKKQKTYRQKKLKFYWSKNRF